MKLLKSQKNERCKLKMLKIFTNFLTHEKNQIHVYGMMNSFAQFLTCPERLTVPVFSSKGHHISTNTAVGEKNIFIFYSNRYYCYLEIH